jgi:hypothetical protein
MIVAGVSAAAAAAWAWGAALLAAMVAYKLMDIMLDVARAFTAVSDWGGSVGVLLMACYVLKSQPQSDHHA